MGFTLSVYNQVLLNDRTSIELDRDFRLTVQPNLRNVKCQQNLDNLWIEFSCPTAIRSNQMNEIPVAPLGLGSFSLPMCYTPIAPLGLFLVRVRLPTSVMISLCYAHNAPVERAAEGFTFNSKSMEFQYLATQVKVSVNGHLLKRLVPDHRQIALPDLGDAEILRQHHLWDNCHHNHS